MISDGGMLLCSTLSLRAAFLAIGLVACRASAPLRLVTGVASIGDGAIGSAGPIAPLAMAETFVLRTPGNFQARGGRDYFAKRQTKVWKGLSRQMNQTLL